MAVVRLVLMLSAYIAGQVANAGLQPSEEWFRCAKSTDCVHIDFECAGGVVNKAFEKAAEEYYRNQSDISTCMRMKPSDAELKVPYRVLCVKHKCVHYGVKKIRN